MTAGVVPDPARGRRAARQPRSASLIVLAVVVAAVIGGLVLQQWAASFPSVVSDTPTPPAPAPSPAPVAPQAGDDPPGQPSPGLEGPDRDRQGALGEADGAIPDGASVFDDGLPGVANLDPDLLEALQQAATDAADDGVEFVVNGGWRSPEYQEQLLDEAISRYGSREEAARWVSTPTTSAHVPGDAVDIGPPAAATWLSEHGADYGLCQIYRNEPWHYELRPDAVDDGCPTLYPDPTHDPRMQQ